MSNEDVIVQLMEKWGGRFSIELGINVDSEKSDDLFRWFLASILFGARISQSIAIRTYREFEKQNIMTPGAIIESGWDGLVEILDRGGYARYDFRTASKLLDIANMLNNIYGGDLNILHEKARDPSDLESRLMEFKGVGPVTVNIFLRELRGVWQKAEPMPGDLAIIAAKHLGFTVLEGKDEKERKKILNELQRLWKKTGLPYRFSDFEAALVRSRLEIRRERLPASPKLFK